MTEAPPPAYIGAYAVIVEDGRLLLTHWVGAPAAGRPPAWTLPGGGIEIGESPEQAVVRELVEETGYDVEVGGILAVHTGWVPLDGGGTGHRVRLLYSASVTGGTLGVVEVDGSTDDAAWVPLSELGGLERVSMVDRAVDLISG